VKFRCDINALRALAVTAVVLFHYKSDFISGGFVGVDVFFVISGYLMTSIIMERLAKGTFDIRNFYYDRAKRIVPGLLCMCVVLLGAGYFLLEPATYHNLASTSISALLFFSNFQFWEATDYFDVQSDVKWLLHTWSLSVEWQFYLLYPILLVTLHKIGKTRSHIIQILWTLSIASLLLCVWFSREDPIAVFYWMPQRISAFYLLPQRAWELLAGGIVALQFANSERKFSRVLLASGSLCIGISLMFYDKNLAWPSYFALLPVIGTCLVIAANWTDASPFNNRFAQTIGKWSYSIYLWHWPVAVAAVYFGFTEKTPLKIGCEIAILAAVIASGSVLLRLFKTVAWGRLAEARLPGIALGGSALALTVGFAIMVTVNAGLPNRRPNGQKVASDYNMAISDWDYPKECQGVDLGGNLRPCQLGPAKFTGTLFLGDSFAMEIYGRFAETAKRNPGESFTFLTSPGCPPITGVRRVPDNLHCNGFIEKALGFAEARDFKRIVLISNWYRYFFLPNDILICFGDADNCTMTQDRVRFFQLVDAALASLRGRLLTFRDRGAEIVIVGATPSGHWNVPAELARRRFLGLDTQNIEYIDRVEFEAKAAPLKSRLKSLASSIDAKFVDPLDFLCDNHRCPTVDWDGVPYFFDRYHFRSGAIKTSRFQYLDEAAGVMPRLRAASLQDNSTP
jgi:peptidoglycan/LPS O-acetylase OafA/YrhL